MNGFDGSALALPKEGDLNPPLLEGQVLSLSTGVFL